MELRAVLRPLAQSPGQAEVLVRRAEGQGGRDMARTGWGGSEEPRVARGSSGGGGRRAARRLMSREMARGGALAVLLAGLLPGHAVGRG